MIYNPGIDKKYFHWRIRIFLALHIGYCIFYCTRKNLTPAIHIFSENLDIDIISLGIITGVFSFVYGIGKIFTGFLADKFNARLLMALGLLLSGIINLFYGFLTSLWLLVFFGVLTAFAKRQATLLLQKFLLPGSPQAKEHKFGVGGIHHTQ